MNDTCTAGEGALDADTSDKPRIGFGCAGLYGLPTSRQRRAVLETAYELGIRHFDVAPIYGLGIAEQELAKFIRGRPDIRVATKFGIRPTLIGRIAGQTQAPIRRVLQRSATTKAKLRSSGGNRDAGRVGRLLYGRHNYEASTARASLDRSLRILRVDRIDHFLLHEPIGQLAHNNSGLVDFLEEAAALGKIGRWGPAGDLSAGDAALADLTGRATVTQMPYGFVDGFKGPGPVRTRTTISFGVLAQSLPEVIRVLRRDSTLRDHCSALLDLNLNEDRHIVQLLIRDAAMNNPGGVVLLSSTKPTNLAAAHQAALTALPNEMNAATLIRQQCVALRGHR